MRQNLLASSNVMKNSQEDYSFQQQYGRTNHSRDSSGDDCTNFCETKGPMSPTAWMCEVTGKKVSQLCRPFMSGNNNVQLGKEDSSSYLKKTSARHDNSDTSVASWRERASKSFLSDHNSEDEDSDDDALKGDASRRPKASPSVRSIAYGDNLKNIISPMSSNVDLSNEEPRIIAPNVDKISPISVVEVRLQSIGECVAILCSVDVLKMRSVFFYEVRNMSVICSAQ